MPDKTPASRDWHVNRAALITSACSGLQRGQQPRVVGLVGPGGAGKTTLASQIVKCVEVLKFFSDGIVWLPGDGNEHGRAPSLMLQLAKSVHESVMGRICRGPTAEDDLAAYVKGRMDACHGGRGLRCLVVADDVCDKEMVAELKRTGMWVLMTTRDIDLVVDAEGEPVQVDELSQEHAEAVFLGASRLELDEYFPDTASELIELCGRFTLDVEFVGRWRPLRRCQNDYTWSEACSDIREQLAAMSEGEGSCKRDAHDIRRAAILRVGLKYLGQARSLSRELYVALAVLPDGYAFSVNDAARLLYGDDSRTAESEKTTREAMRTLESWAVLSPIGYAHYRMQDAHACFARENLMDSKDARQQAVRRWGDYISSLDTVRLLGDVRVLAGLWRALGRVGGDCWRAARPYEEALAEMDVSDPFYFPSLEAVASLYSVEGDRDGAAAVMRRILDLYDLNPELNPRVFGGTLWFCAVGVAINGGESEEQVVRLQLGAALQDPKFERWRCDPQRYADATIPAPMEESFSLYVLGVCLSIVGRSKETEALLRRALAKQQASEIAPDHSLVAYITHMLGHCLRQAGRPAEAMDCLQKMMTAMVNKLGPDDILVACLLHELGASVREAGWPQQGETLVWRALEIKEATLAADDLQVAFSLHELGVCVRDGGRPVEAQQIFVQVYRYGALLLKRFGGRKRRIDYPQSSWHP